MNVVKKKLGAYSQEFIINNSCSLFLFVIWLRHEEETIKTKPPLMPVSGVFLCLNLLQWFSQNAKSCRMKPTTSGASTSSTKLENKIAPPFGGFSIFAYLEIFFNCLTGSSVSNANGKLSAGVQENLRFSRFSLEKLLTAHLFEMI